MYSNKFGRLMFGLKGLKATSACGAFQRAAARSGFNWAAVCKQRTLWQQRSACAGMHQTGSAIHTTVDPGEVKRFQLLANKWWDEEGEFAALHAMNDLRVPFVRDNLLNAQRERHPGQPLAGLRILDVGCGGGLLSEPLGRLGATVSGIDPVEDSVRIAQQHAAHDPDLRDRVSYRACTLEELAGEGEAQLEPEPEQGVTQFDAVVASEVVEHLADLDTFAVCCSRVLKPGGSLFITTLNKTNLSYALAIVVAEQLLHIVPRGTHDWEKFISPVELERLLESNGFLVQSVQGMLYNPISGAWSWTNNTEINYALHVVKQDDKAEDGSTPPGGHNEVAHS